jgi:hypothetical protein
MNWHELFNKGLNEYLEVYPEADYLYKREGLWAYIGYREEVKLREHARDMPMVKDPRYVLTDCHYMYAGVKIVVVRLPTHLRFSLTRGHEK